VEGEMKRWEEMEEDWLKKMDGFDEMEDGLTS
jgi:hypothetical protein